MDNILRQISEKKHKLDKFKPFPQELVKNLEEWLKVELTYSSNAIEGNTLSRIETAEVIERGTAAVISGKSLKDQLEAINHAKAVESIKQLAKELKSHQSITEKVILDIHKIIFTGLSDDWAGKYRRIEVFIRGSNAEFPRPNAIPYAMKKFIRWLEGQQEEHPVKIAADAHFKFVSIHPFIDGNGRATRLLMNLILLLNGYPMAIIRKEDRIAYLNSFETERSRHDLSPFYELIFIAVDRSLDIYLNIAEGKHQVLKGFDSSSRNLLKIGELAQITGETIHTLRYWTKMGILEVADITRGGYQLYSSDAIEQVKRIRKLQQEKRLTIEEIKEVLKIKP